MRHKFQGIFLAITLLLGVATFPVSSNESFEFNQAYAVEVGVEAETEIEVQVGSDDDSNEAESESEMEAKMESTTELEIEVHVSGDKTTIEIEMDGEEKMYVLNTSSEAEIIAKIKTETSLTESEIKAIWVYNQDTKTKMQSSKNAKIDLETKIELQTKGITNASMKAKERAKILISHMEEKPKETSERFNQILLKAKAEGYLGNKASNDDSVKSYSLNLDGTAQTQSKVTSSMDGTLYLESMKKASNVSKYKVSAGQILIDGQTYDVLFGKARATSTSNTEAGSKMILIAEVMKPDGEVTTLKMLMQTDSSLNSQTDTSSWSVMNPQSKIAGSWKMDAKATMSMTSA